MLQFAKNNKNALIVVGAAAGIAAVGAGIYHKVKNREPEAVTKFKAALKEYIAAIRTGQMNVGLIDQMMVSLDELKKRRDYERISIQLSTEELDLLVNRISEFFRALECWGLFI